MPTNTWLLTVSVKDVWTSFGANLITFEDARNAAAERIKASGWRNLTPYPHTFDELVANLEASENLSEFGTHWEELYDLADSDRVWIETF